MAEVADTSSEGRPLFTAAERDRIEAAVGAAEQATRGQIVPMVVRASDTYPGARWRLAVALALLSTTVGLLALPAIDPLYFMAALVPLLGAGHLLATLPPLLRLALSRAEVDEEVRQRAHQAFLELGLHGTRERTGVLLFVSLLEHRIEVIADTGITDAAPDDLWTEVVARLAERIRQGALADGLVEAIERCGAVLAEHFPRTGGPEPDQLPDRLVT